MKKEAKYAAVSVKEEKVILAEEINSEINLFSGFGKPPEFSTVYFKVSSSSEA